MYISEGEYSKDEVEALFGTRLATGYNRDTGVLNEHWSSIRHPQTYEKLESVCCYCNPENTRDTYYAEFRGESGKTYHYLNENHLPAHLKEGKTTADKDIYEQIREDHEECIKNYAQSQQQQPQQSAQSKSNEVNKDLNEHSR